MRKKGKLAAAGLLLCAAAIGGTWAYFNQTMTVTNEFDTGTYDTELVEEFKPSEGENWEPGTEIDKVVTVKNTGTLPVVVRVKFEEKWERDGDAFYKYDTEEDKDKIEIADQDPTGDNKFENVYQTDPNDGYAGTDADDSVVHKSMPNLGSDWVYNSSDGYYYYTKILDGAVENADGTTTYAETSKLLDSVTLCENADMGYYNEIKYYATVSDASPSDADWTEFTKESGEYVSTSRMNELLEGLWEITFMKSETKVAENLMGYSGADYTLTITAQTVQATQNAVSSVFGTTKYWDLASDDSYETN